MFHILLFLLLPLISALQTPERHFGCPEGKNVCIYPIPTATLQSGTLFDFQVSLHIPNNETLPLNFRRLLSIKLRLPSGRTLTPEKLFRTQPELRTWPLQSTLAGIPGLPSIPPLPGLQGFLTPPPFDSYALAYRNVKLDTPGVVTVTVRARVVRTVAKWTVRAPTKRRAKNVILFVGDGMSPAMLSAARLVSRGMTLGKYNAKLHMQTMPRHALINPAGVDSIITDSANSASAFNAGHKSSSGALGLYADSGGEEGHPKYESIAEYVKRTMGIAVGVVTTAEVQDATPAAVWAHVRRREMKEEILKQALDGCEGCATKVAPDVLMGGGGRYFVEREDGVDMYKRFRKEGYTVTHTRKEMLREAKRAKKLLMVGHWGDMETWLDRNVYKENMNVEENSPRGDGRAPTDQPNLDEMTMAALEVLKKNKNGFYLMVEAASIDKMAHAQDVPRMLSDVIELDNTVAKTIEWAKKNGDETLILVTADHAQGFDVFGTVDTAIWDAAVVASEERPVSDVEHMCEKVKDNTGREFDVTREEATGQRVREANLARRLAIGSYLFAGYPDYQDKDGDGFPDSWEVRTTLAAGMNNYPDHTEDYKVSRRVKRPAFLTRSGVMNNPVDHPNGLFLTGNLSPFIPSSVHTLQDVDLFAYGPGSEGVRGNLDNTEVYHIVAETLGFGGGNKMKTAGRFEKSLEGMVPCRNSGEACHCQQVEDEYKCACGLGVQAFVMEDMAMCEVRRGVMMPV